MSIDENSIIQFLLPPAIFLLYFYFKKSVHCGVVSQVTITGLLLHFSWTVSFLINHLPLFFHCLAILALFVPSPPPLLSIFVFIAFFPLFRFLKHNFKSGQWSRLTIVSPFLNDEIKEEQTKTTYPFTSDASIPLLATQDPSLYFCSMQMPSLQQTFRRWLFTS